MANVEEIVSLFNKLESDNSERRDSYDEVVKFYGGDSYRDIKKKGFLAGITNQIQSIFHSNPRDEDVELKTPINIVKPAIENKVAYLALPPTIRVIEPPDTLAPQAEAEQPQITPGQPAPQAAPEEEVLSPEEWSIDLADRLENVIQSLLKFANMPRRCRDAAWSMAAMDGAVLGVWPDLRKGLPRIFTRTPQDFYPVAYDPDGLELAKALWMEKIPGEEVFARWGNKNYMDEKEVEVIQYIDEKNYCTVLNKTEWAHAPIENKMGLVPIVCVGSLGLPGMIFGSTNIKDAIPVAKLINTHMQLTEEMAAAIVKPTIAVRDPINVPDGIAIGEGGVITMGASGGVDLLGPLSLPNAWWQLGSVLQSWFDLIADNPAVLRAEGGGSLITGKGFNAQLGPIAARMQTNLEILMGGWRQVIKYMLLMWADFPGTNTTVTASGIKSKETFYFKAEPKDFFVDGQIWTEVDVFLEAQAYIDRQGNTVELMQLVQNELISIDTAMDNIPLVGNKKRERAKINRDRQWKSEGLAIQNQAANSPMTANPNMADQQMINYGMERGLVGEAGPPGQREGDPNFGVTPESAAPMGEMGMGEEDVMDILKDFFANIPKLKGSVWIGGAPILNPQAFSDENWKVTVWVEVAQDKGTITRAAEKVPEIYGHLTFIVGQPDPKEGAIQVASASPEEGMMEEGIPPEGMPEGADMMGLPPEMLNPPEEEMV